MSGFDRSPEDDVANVYDTVAEEYAEAFSGEHGKKPKDQEILRRFAHEIKDKGPVWDFGCGPGQTGGYGLRSVPGYQKDEVHDKTHRHRSV